MALLQEEVPSWTEIAGSRDPVPSLSSAPKPDCRIPQLRSLASHPAHLSFQYLASPTAPPGPKGCLPGVPRTARGRAGPLLQAAGWQEASSASAGGEAAAPPSGPLSYPRSSSGVLVALLLWPARSGPLSVLDGLREGGGGGPGASDRVSRGPGIGVSGPGVGGRCEAWRGGEARGERGAGRGGKAKEGGV